MPLYYPSGGSSGSVSSVITASNVGGTQQFMRDEQVYYEVTDVVAATAIGAVGRREAYYVGTAGSNVYTGSSLGVESSMYVRNHSQAGSEQCAFFGVLRYDQGTGFANSGTAGRAWFTDWTLHGAIAQQQQLLTGLNLVLGNYYDGQPSESASVGIALSANNAGGGSLDATHSAATRYPNGVGIAIVGAVAGGTGRGWEIGLQVGGGSSSSWGALTKLAASGWNNTTSKLGTGILVRDHQVAGLAIGPRNTTGDALVTDPSAGPVAFGRTTSLSSVLTAQGAFAAPAADPASQMISFLSTDAQASGRGASIGLGGTTVDAATTWRNFVLIAGRKANSTTADTSGYLQIQVNKSGVGLQQVLRADIDGVLTLFDGGTIVTGATTGTKIGTATTDKIGLYGVTPIVQRAGAAQAAVATTAATNVTPWGFSTQAQADAIVALVNELRAALVALGAIKGAA